MDIDAALENMRGLMQEAFTGEHDNPEALLENMAYQFDAIDTWLSAGGFLPRGWSWRDPKHTPDYAEVVSATLNANLRL
jgi:hypothetical protein